MEKATTTWLKQGKQPCSCERGDLCKYTCKVPTCKEYNTANKFYCLKCMEEFNLHPHKAVEILEGSTWMADDDKLNDVSRDFESIIAKCETYLPIMSYLSNSQKPNFKSEYLADCNKLISAASAFKSLRNEFEHLLGNNNFEKAQQMASGLNDHVEVLSQVGYLRDLSEEMLYNHYNQFLINQTFAPFEGFS